MNSSPRHIAVIMDGNGRWARKRNLPRIMGHKAGMETARKIAEECARRKIEALTLYTFSTENWKRSKDEVEGLMSLLEQTVIKKKNDILKSNMRFNVIGRMGELSDTLQAGLKGLIQEASANTGMILTLALNYGGRQEIVDAVRNICIAEKGRDMSSFSEKDFSGYLYTRDLPDPDLVIRTSGEMRLSNFLIWQSAYSEFYVTDTLWPDFGALELSRAIDDYAGRERRFGE